MPGRVEDLVVELIADPARPAMLIDERRFGPAHGFEGERIVFAGVLTKTSVLRDFALAVEAVRATFDPQKRARALKSADVLRGRHARALGAAVEAAFSSSSVSFWAAAMPHLADERRLRTRPAATDVNNGRAINGAETPIVDMISGLVCERDADVRQFGRLEVFVDRSQQNGLHELSATDFTVYDVPIEGAPALHGGKPIRLGAGVRRRMFAVCELTPVFGDWILLADLAAHLWGHEPAAVNRLRDSRLLNAVEAIGTAPGHVLIEQMEIVSPRAKR